MDLIARFLKDTDQRLSDLTKGASNPLSDVELVGLVHRMTGTAAMFGAARLHRHLTRIEDMCKTGRKADARAEVPALVELWRQTAEAYRSIGSLAQASSLR